MYREQYREYAYWCLGVESKFKPWLVSVSLYGWGESVRLQDQSGSVSKRSNCNPLSYQHSIENWPYSLFFSPCRLRLCFNCVMNKYFRGYDRELDLSGWQSRVASFSSITRKVERDWKMVRVCASKSSVTEKLLINTVYCEHLTSKI